MCIIPCHQWTGMFRINIFYNYSESNDMWNNVKVVACSDEPERTVTWIYSSSWLSEAL